MIGWVIIVVASGFALTMIVERALAHFNVRPADPDARPGGLPEIAARIERWAQERQRKTPRR